MNKVSAPVWPPSWTTASNSSSNLARSRPPSASPILFDHGLQVRLHTCLITASKFALSWPASVYLQTRSITPSKSISRLAPIWPPSSHDHGLQVHLQTPSITSSKFALSWPPSAYLETRTHAASKFARSRPPSAYPNSLDHSLQVYPQTRKIRASMFAQSRPQSPSLSSLDHGVVKWWT